MWNPLVGEVLQCKRAPYNVADQYSVAVKKRSCWTFTAKNIKTLIAHSSYGGGGTIDWMVTRARGHSTDLPQGGLEVPCSLLAVYPRFRCAVNISLQKNL